MRCGRDFSVTAKTDWLIKTQSETENERILHMAIKTYILCRKDDPPTSSFSIGIANNKLAPSMSL